MLLRAAAFGLARFEHPASFTLRLDGNNLAGLTLDGDAKGAAANLAIGGELLGGHESIYDEGTGLAAVRTKHLRVSLH